MITAEELYELLPAIYRIRDVEQGGPLRALVDVFAEQANLADADIAQLYDNWFIETCEEWVVPYIGELLGVRALNDFAGARFSQRARVANAIRFRRRKGTVTMLEQVARDFSGWPARAVEFFQLLDTTQNVNHVRIRNHRTPDLRDTNALESLETPFQTAARTAEVRRISSRRGKYNIPNVGLFLWRLQSYPIARGTARAVSDPPDGRFTFSPLGLDSHLFNRPRTESEITHLANETNVPGKLRRRPLFDELQAVRVDSSSPLIHFGPNPVIELYSGANLTPIPPARIAICNLANWRRPTATDIDAAVDPVLGRIAFPESVDPGPVNVTFAYGFSGDFGGGPYNRSASVATALIEDLTFQRGVQANAPPDDPAVRSSIVAALADWDMQPAGGVGLITIMDSCSYEADLEINVPPGSRLVIAAADWPAVDDPGIPGIRIRLIGRYAADDVRPHLRGNVKVALGPGGGEPGKLVLDGLLIEGTLNVEDRSLASLRVAHCTLVPAKGGLAVTATSAQIRPMEITLDRVITGPINLPKTVATLEVSDSIVDKDVSDTAIQAAGVATRIERSTVFGPVTVHSLDAGNSIFMGAVTVARRQIGCLRFSYVPDESHTPLPRRHRCQPDFALQSVESAAERQRARGRLKPIFNSLTYGAAEYAQLAENCAIEIRTGAEDGSEMGVFAGLQQPQREANLREALDEYLRFGLEAGLFFAT